MYKKILLPTDGSKNSESAIIHALTIASDEHAEIIILNVVDSKHLSSLPDEALDKDANAIFEKHSEKAISRVKEIIKENEDKFNVKVSTLSLEGNPSEVILKVCEKDDIDMVVMANSGKHMVDRFLLGSVTEKTIRQSPVPVLIIPANKNRK
ncbi:MAG: universal stress protein [Methanosphaera sp.]|nr:universal stress protein [Methanosphaera sp.]